MTNVPVGIAACVKPLHFNYDQVSSSSHSNDFVRSLILLSFQALYMLEFLELNNLLGVSHFTFYNRKSLVLFQEELTI